MKLTRLRMAMIMCVAFWVTVLSLGYSFLGILPDPPKSIEGVVDYDAWQKGEFTEEQLAYDDRYSFFVQGNEEYVVIIGPHAGSAYMVGVFNSSGTFVAWTHDYGDDGLWLSEWGGALDGRVVSWSEVLEQVVDD